MALELSYTLQVGPSLTSSGGFIFSSQRQYNENHAVTGLLTGGFLIGYTITEFNPFANPGHFSTIAAVDGFSTSTPEIYTTSAANLYAGGNGKFTTTPMPSLDFIAGPGGVGLVVAGNVETILPPFNPLASDAADLFGSLLDDGGHAKQTDLQIVTSTGLDQLDPRITANWVGAGGYLTAWTDNNPIYDGTDIVARIFTSGGMATTTPFVVTTAASSIGQQSEPTVAAITNGDYVIAWQDAASDGSGTGLRARIFDAAGVARGADFAVNQTTSGDQKFLEIHALGTTGFIGVWTTPFTGGPGFITVARIFNEDGSARTDEFVVGSAPSAAAAKPSVVTLFGGGFAIAFSAPGTGGADHPFLQEFDSNGTAVSPPVEVGPAGAREIEIGTMADGRLVATYIVLDNGTGAIFANVYDPRTTALNLTGSSQNDGFVGTHFGDYINGSGGNDSLQGGDGTDTLLGGDGNDTLKGGSADDQLDGGAGIDALDLSDTGTNLTVVLVDGGTLVVPPSGTLTDTVISIEGVITGSGNDTITGSSSANTIDAGAGDDNVNAGDGDDTIVGSGAGNDTYNGEAGIDTVDYSPSTSSLTIDLGAPSNQASGSTTGTDQLSGIENVVGGSGDDTITGDQQNNRITGGTGADVLHGGAGHDTLSGNQGADTLFGDGGNDTFFIETSLDLIGENTNQGTDTVISTLSYVIVANVENLTLVMGAGLIDGLGNAEDNIITGNDSRNGVTGGLGNDTIIGNGGDDAIDGGFGADSMVGGTGVDTYYVDNADDQVVETEAGPLLYDTVWTKLATYTLPANVEIYIAIPGAGSINGDGNDLVTLMLGNEGGNVLNAYAGDDMILGLSGNDTIDAGTSEILDIISGGGGADSLTGGGGHDFFNYENIGQGGDVITDFATNAGDEDDILDFRPLFPTFTNTAGVSTVAQAVASGHLTFTQAGADTQVFADADGLANNNVLMVTLLNTTAGNVQTYTLI